MSTIYKRRVNHTLLLLFLISFRVIPQNNVDSIVQTQDTIRTKKELIHIGENNNSKKNNSVDTLEFIIDYDISYVYQYSMIILILLLLIFGGLLFYQYKRKQLYRSRFKRLMSEKTEIETNNTISPFSINKTISVPQKHIEDIMSKLNDFEISQKYLLHGITVQSLAKDMNTNVKYLSLVINQYKEKSFITYLNSLRISHTIKELKGNSNLRKYTVKAIAHEVGFNSAETFSKAFYKEIGIKPSYFLKQLNKKMVR